MFDKAVQQSTEPSTVQTILLHVVPPAHAFEGLEDNATGNNASCIFSCRAEDGPTSGNLPASVSELVKAFKEHVADDFTVECTAAEKTYIIARSVLSETPLTLKNAAGGTRTVRTLPCPITGDLTKCELSFGEDKILRLLSSRAAEKIREKCETFERKSDLADQHVRVWIVKNAP